jgi:N-sulfoglucosamine sulfohydrolase
LAEDDAIALCVVDWSKKARRFASAHQYCLRSCFTVGAFDRISGARNELDRLSDRGYWVVNMREDTLRALLFPRGPTAQTNNRSKGMRFYSPNGLGSNWERLPGYLIGGASSGRRLLQAVLVVVMLALSACTRISPRDTAVSEGASEGVPPNVLIFLADDLTFRDLGVAGNPDVITPNIEQLSAEGIRFDLAFSSSAMCAPTRMELYTGLHPVRSGAHANHSQVRPGVRSMPNYLRAMGYRVAITGKRHEWPPESFSFDFLGGVHPDGRRRDERGWAGKEGDLDAVRRFLKEGARDGVPWALVYASNQPHTPWNLGDVSNYTPEALTVPPDLIDTPETRAALAQYYAEISYLDGRVGEVLAALDETGQRYNTMVLFLSEQGSNFPFAKWTLYDRGHRAAMIARWPGHTQRGAVSQVMVQYADVTPTIVELAGGDPGAHDFDGCSFARALRGDDRDPCRTAAYGVHTTNGIDAGAEAYAIRAIRTPTRRLIWNLNHDQAFANTVSENGGPYDVLSSWIAKGQKGDAVAAARAASYVHRPEFELYDLTLDPHELNNIADNPAYADDREALFARLQDWMAEQGDRGVETERQGRATRAPDARRIVPLGIPAGGRALDVVAEEERALRASPD